MENNSDFAFSSLSLLLASGVSPCWLVFRSFHRSSHKSEMVVRICLPQFGLWLLVWASNCCCSALHLEDHGPLKICRHPMLSCWWIKSRYGVSNSDIGSGVWSLHDVIPVNKSVCNTGSVLRFRSSFLRVRRNCANQSSEWGQQIMWSLSSFS